MNEHTDEYQEFDGMELEEAELEKADGGAGANYPRVYLVVMTCKSCGAETRAILTTSPVTQMGTYAERVKRLNHQKCKCGASNWHMQYRTMHA